MDQQRSESTVVAVLWKVSGSGFVDSVGFCISALCVTDQSCRQPNVFCLPRSGKLTCGCVTGQKFNSTLGACTGKSTVNQLPTDLINQMWRFSILAPKLITNCISWANYSASTLSQIGTSLPGGSYASIITLSCGQCVAWTWTGANGAVGFPIYIQTTAPNYYVGIVNLISIKRLKCSFVFTDNLFSVGRHSIART